MSINRKIMSLDKNDKKTVDPFMLFSIGKKNDIDRVSCPNILVNGSSDEETEDGQALQNENIAKKLSFNCSDEKSFLGNHEVFLLPSDFSESSNDEDDKVEKAEQNQETRKIEETEYIPPSKLKLETKSEEPTTSYRRIVRLASSSSSDSSESEDGDASFDLGAIKKKYTPKPRNQNVSDNLDDDNEYDLQDSFIDDDTSEASYDSTASSCDEDYIEENDDSASTCAEEDYVEDHPLEEESSRKEKLPFLKTPATSKLKYTTTEFQSGSAFKKVLSKTFLQSLGDKVIGPTTHPDSKKYIEKYKKNKEELAAMLFKMYNANVFGRCLPSNMSLIWSKTLTKTAGRCKQKLKKENRETTRWCEIELSVKVLTTADRLRDTLIHELCHASCWIISESNCGHGPQWKRWANKAMKFYPELPIIERCHTYKIEAKFAYKCLNCGYLYKRHSKSIDTERKRCGKIGCKGQLELNQWDAKSEKYVKFCESGISKTPNAFAVFVKDNYKYYRTPGSTHKDAMNELSKKFAKTKLDK